MRILTYLISIPIVLVNLGGCKTDEKSESPLSADQQSEYYEGIKSWDKVAAELSEMDQDPTSKGCEKLDKIWGNIEKYEQTMDDLVPAESDFSDVLKFGNGSEIRFWKIFSGWSAADWDGKDLGDDVRPYVEGRIKDAVRLTHRFAVYAKMKYVPVEGQPYGGHYKGNDCVLGRLSSAVPTGVEERFTPAVSAKFFTDGQNPSQVLIAQHDIGGQSSGQDEEGRPIPTEINNNFYAKYLSNRLSFEAAVPNGFGAFSRFLYSTLLHFNGKPYDPRELAASHLAATKPDGTSGSGNGPRFIWMAPPTSSTKNNFKQLAVEDLDFRKHFMQMNDTAQFQDEPVVLFNVYAAKSNWSYEPVDPELDPANFERAGPDTPKLIGRFVLAEDSRIIASEAADIRLFFKHTFGNALIQSAEINNEIYHRDYPLEKWYSADNPTVGEEMFTSLCSLGAKMKEVEPSKPGSLEGSFLKSAIVTDARKDTDGTLCSVKIFGPKITDAIKAKLSQVQATLKANQEKVYKYFEKL